MFYSKEVEKLYEFKKLQHKMIKSTVLMWI